MLWLIQGHPAFPLFHVRSTNAIGDTRAGIMSRTGKLHFFRVDTSLAPEYYSFPLP
jgi:hypothetical protein